MAKALVNNYKDTVIDGTTSVSLTLPTLNYARDFRVKLDGGKESIITNLTSPIDQPERFRFAHSDVADVYKGSGIDPTLYYQSRKGTQVLVQLTDVLGIEDPDVPEYKAVLPLSVHMVIKVPNNDLITEDVIMGEVSRMIAGLYETTGTTTEPRLRGILRGALLPTAL
jgi:hypothetical protein